MSKVCKVEGCHNWATRPGDLCLKHWMRLQRHGHTDQTRPKDWGTRTRHPLYKVWLGLKRTQNSTLCDAWRDDFWLFVSDAGEYPGKDFILCRINDKAPLGLDNFKWGGRYSPTLNYKKFVTDRNAVL